MEEEAEAEVEEEVEGKVHQDVVAASSRTGNGNRFKWKKNKWINSNEMIQQCPNG